MTAQAYKQLIIEGIQELPTELLAEIADFIYFVHKRIVQPQSYEDELQSILLKSELSHLDDAEATHLEKEFEGYEQRYPRE